MEVTGAARLYRAASSGPQGWASWLHDRPPINLFDALYDERIEVGVNIEKVLTFCTL